MNINNILQNFGLTDKEIQCFSALLALGPSPVRDIVKKSGLNRGTSYNILSSLLSKGVIYSFEKNKYQYFAVEPVEKFLVRIEEKKQLLAKLETEIGSNLPELQEVFNTDKNKPKVKVFESYEGIKWVLNDLLKAESGCVEKEYYVYSVAGLRKDIYHAMPDFSDIRIKKGVKVKTIALGGGGSTVGLDERKWLMQNSDICGTYQIIYKDHVAHISVHESGQPIAVLINSPAIYQEQKTIFLALWNRL